MSEIELGKYSHSISCYTIQSSSFLFHHHHHLGTNHFNFFQNLLVYIHSTFPSHIPPLVKYEFTSEFGKYIIIITCVWSTFIYNPSFILFSDSDNHKTQVSLRYNIIIYSCGYLCLRSTCSKNAKHLLALSSLHLISPCLCYKEIATHHQPESETLPIYLLV